MTNETEEKIYREAMNSEGRERTNLLGVLRKGMHHNLSSSYSFTVHLVLLECLSDLERGGKHLEDTLSDEISARAGLIQRHMRDAQHALQEIYELAKQQGYTDIVSIFEKEYKVGHPTPVDDSVSPISDSSKS